MLDGAVVEDPEDDGENVEVDEETGNKTCRVCFNFPTGEDTEPVLISFTVRNETNTNTSLDNIEAVSNDHHPPLEDNIPYDALETSRQSGKIVTDLLDILITDIVTNLLIIVSSSRKKCTTLYK